MHPHLSTLPRARYTRQKLTHPDCHLDFAFWGGRAASSQSLMHVARFSLIPSMNIDNWSLPNFGVRENDAIVHLIFLKKAFWGGRANWRRQRTPITASHSPTTSHTHTHTRTHPHILLILTHPDCHLLGEEIRTKRSNLQKSASIEPRMSPSKVILLLEARRRAKKGKF